jgi:hypothetical protein
MTKTFKVSAFYDRNSVYRKQNRKSYRTHTRANIATNNIDGLDDVRSFDKGRYGKNGYTKCQLKDFDASHPYITHGTPKDVGKNSNIFRETKGKFYHNTRINKYEMINNMIDD